MWQVLQVASICWSFYQRKQVIQKKINQLNQLMMITMESSIKIKHKVTNLKKVHHCELLRISIVLNYILFLRNKRVKNKNTNEISLNSNLTRWISKEKIKLFNHKNSVLDLINLMNMGQTAFSDRDQEKETFCYVRVQNS